MFIDNKPSIITGIRNSGKFLRATLRSVLGKISSVNISLPQPDLKETDANNLNFIKGKPPLLCNKYLHNLVKILLVLPKSTTVRLVAMFSLTPTRFERN